MAEDAGPIDFQPSCKCGLPATERTVSRETVNKGRRFYCCGGESNCNFFRWVDTVQNKANNSQLAAPIDPRRVLYRLERMMQEMEKFDDMISSRMKAFVFGLKRLYDDVNETCQI